MDWTRLEVQDEHGNSLVLYQCEELKMPQHFLPLDPGKRMQMIKNIKYQQDAIIIASYPKTGTHWMANLVHFLKSDGPVESVSSVSPVLVDLMPLDMWQRAEHTSTISSHLHPNRMPREHVENRGKIILMARDPRDTAVSLFHYVTKHEKMQCPEISWNCFLDAFLKGNVPFGCYFEYYNTWLGFLEENKMDAIIVFFEDLKENGIKELDRVQKFLRKSYTTEHLLQILDRCTLQNLKSEVDSGKLKTPLVDKEGKSILYRKGVVGDWKNYFTVAQSEDMDKIIKEKFKDSIFARYQYNK